MTRRSRARTAAGLALALLAAPAAAAPEAAAPAGHVVQFRELTLEVGSRRAGLVWGRFDGDERLDLLVAGDADVSIYFQTDTEGFAPPVFYPLGERLRGGLFDVAELEPDGPSELVVLHEAGVSRFRFDPQAALLERPPLVAGLRGISFTHLTQDDFLYDLDGDGDEDFAFPQNGRYLLYLQENGVFRRAGQVKTEDTRVSASVGREALAEELRSRIIVPRLQLEDADGDGRLDVRRSDGTFVALPEPGEEAVSAGFVVSAVADDPLEDFKRRHGIDFQGQGIRVGTDGATAFQAIRLDIDDDEIEDYTIVYQNRIWVYKGSESGFDFDRPPDQLLKVSAVDRIMVALMPLNADTRPDMVIFKFEVPSIARLIAALAIGLRAEVELLGYENDGDPVFSRKPDHRSTFVIKVPPLLALLGQIEELGEEFQEIFRPIQGISTGDYNGDGVKDVLRLSDDRLQIFLTLDGEEPLDLTRSEGREILQAFGGHELILETLFGRPRTDVTLESSMSWLRDLVGTVESSFVAGREPTLSLPVPEGDARRIAEIISRDLNGDAIDDIVAFLDPPKPRSGEEIEAVDTGLQTLRLWMSDTSGAPADAPAGD